MGSDMEGAVAADLVLLASDLVLLASVLAGRRDELAEAMADQIMSRAPADGALAGPQASPRGRVRTMPTSATSVPATRLTSPATCPPPWPRCAPAASPPWPTWPARAWDWRTCVT